MVDREPVLILHVEDNPDHAKLVQICFLDHPVPNTIKHVSDGEAALDYLFRRGPFANPEASPIPKVILLDLRLPRMDGLEVLKIVKENERLRGIPVVVLTTSESDSDIRQAYQLHTNSYLVKPVDYESFSKMMNDMGSYWFERNRAPRL
ncbi:MAG: response regulator [candidate division FCPU426 bacterium]